MANGLSLAATDATCSFSGFRGRDLPNDPWNRCAQRASTDHPRSPSGEANTPHRTLASQTRRRAGSCMSNAPDRTACLHASRKLHQQARASHIDNTASILTLPRLVLGSPRPSSMPCCASAATCPGPSHCSLSAVVLLLGTGLGSASPQWLHVQPGLGSLRDSSRSAVHAASAPDSKVRPGIRARAKGRLAMVVCRWIGTVSPSRRKESKCRGDARVWE